MKVIDPFEMVEVENEEHAGVRRERIIERAHQLATVSEPRSRIRIGIAVGEPRRCIIGLEGFLKVFRAAPAEQDDGNIEQEGNAERAAGVGDRCRAQCLRNDAAAEHDEQQDGCRGRAGRDDVATRDADGLATHPGPCSFHPLVQARFSQREVKIILRRGRLTGRRGLAVHRPAGRLRRSPPRGRNHWYRG